MASRISLTFLMAISVAIFCVSSAQSQEQYLNQGYQGYQRYEEPHGSEQYIASMGADPAQLVVENRAPDFFWRPMRSSGVNQFLVRPTRASPNAKKSQLKTKDFFWRPMRSSGVNQFLVRPTRASPNAKKSQLKTKDFFWRPMRSSGVNQFLVRPTRIPTATNAKTSDFFFMRPMKREYFVVRRSSGDSHREPNPFWVRPTRSSPM